MITTQILTKNNEKTIERTLQSLKSLPTEIIIADLGSTDKTIEICKDLGANIFTVKFDYNYSSIRNLIVKQSKTEWQMMIHPWEALDEDVRQIKEALSHTENCKLLVLKGDLLTKELRLWRKGTAVFDRPVYENLEPTVGKTLNVMVYSDIAGGLGMTHEILMQWKERFPLSAEPDYYLACTYLMHRKYDDFLRVAEHYLFLKNTSDESVLLLRYYLSLVNCYIKRNPNKSLTNIMECIGSKPLMAEFWCMLGDIYLHMKEFERATSFYQNAILMGSKRDPNDEMPMELSKYDEYPQKMITAIGKAH